jgi:hypothetical protein
MELIFFWISKVPYLFKKMPSFCGTLQLLYRFH